MGDYKTNDHIVNSQERDDRQPVLEKVPTIRSQRWLLSFVGFFGCLSTYAMRTNMSVAIVCMVNDTASPENSTASSSNDDHGEFFWTKSQQTLVLSSYFYGYFSTQILGGWLSGHLGPKRVLGVGMMAASVLTLLLPLGSRYNLELVIALRAMTGMASGVIYPSFYGIWGNWAPPLENTKLTGLCYSGASFGTILTFALSGILCQYGFGGGWPSIFYLTGGFGFLWSLLWLLLVADTPSSHPCISDAERQYIVDSMGSKVTSERRPVPWVSIVTSLPVWAILIAHWTGDYAKYTLLTGLPTFLKEVYNVDITSNGLLSAIPYLTEALSVNVFGHLSDWIRARGFLSTVSTRKVFQDIAFIGAAGFLSGIGFISANNVALAVAFLGLATFSLGVAMGGHSINVIDIAPRYAGEAFGFINCIGTTTGFITPLVIGALTPHKTQPEWANVFFVCVGLALLGLVLYTWLAEGDVQPWASDSYEVIVPSPRNHLAFYSDKTPLISPRSKSSVGAGLVNSTSI